MDVEYGLRARLSMAFAGWDRNSEEPCLPQTAAEITQARPFRDLPLAVLIGTVTAGFPTSRLRAGAQGFLIKGAPDQLIQAIHPDSQSRPGRCRGR